MHELLAHVLGRGVPLLSPCTPHQAGRELCTHGAGLVQRQATAATGIPRHIPPFGQLSGGAAAAILHSMDDMTLEEEVGDRVIWVIWDLGVTSRSTVL